MVRLKVLCLHGSHQDAEIFSQRIKKLTDRLSDVADFTFVSSPHELPLQDGQEVAMRSWWVTRPPVASAAPAQTPTNTEAASWMDNVVSEWKESLLNLEWTWTENNGFDGILGFSNGAAAAFLLAAHCLANPRDCPGLKFAIMVGGYVPKPLERLLPPKLVTSRGPDVLSAPLAVPSLHIMGATDDIIPVSRSEELARLFQENSCQCVVHEKNHIVPQQKQYIDAVREFMLQAASGRVIPSAPKGRPVVPKQEVDSAGRDTGGYTAPVSAPAPTLPPPAQQVQPVSTLAVEESVPAPDPDYEMSEEQQEELLSLEAIFMDEYCLVSPAPPKFTISLREPGLDADDPDGPPSRLFTLRVTLPQGYPSSQEPFVEVIGPLAGSDPRYILLQQVIKRVTAENMEMGCGSVYQVVEAAKEWIDGNLPANIQDEKPGGESVAAAAAALESAEGLPTTNHVWWENEEADSILVKEAIQEASSHWWWRPPGGHEAESVSDQSDAHELAQKGRWDYVVGLVGKPSAGKSTFFNAVTDPATDEEGAKVGSFPFTTIEPNVSRGFVLVPDPATALGLDVNQCHASFGHAPGFKLDNINPRYSNVDCLKAWAASTKWGSDVAWRRLPVTVKDVAGLVPGAYKGRGHGNAFLADLCDADVLIHVVDISGSTDREGVVLRAGEGADPLDDIGWVKEELHRWVYNNVRSKWSTVLKKPNKLPGLFSGYRASRALVESVLQRIGIPPGSLNADGATLMDWTEADLHRLVAHFLQTRFPIMLACNKADLGTAESHLVRVRELLPHEPMVAVSAASERWLCQQRRAGAVVYQDGASSANGVVELMGMGTGPKFDSLCKNVLGKYGSTGAAAAISAAVALRPPRVAFPVADLDTFIALPAPTHVSGGGVLGAGADAKARANDTSGPRVLRDAVFMKPGSSVEDLYQVLTKPPYQLLDGDYVRAECRVIRGKAATRGALPGQSDSTAASKAHVLKKDDLVTWDNCVVRMATNRKAHFQRK